MTGHGEKMSREQEVAIAALLVEANLESAAQRAGISERTLRRWMHDSGFRTAFEAARRSVFDSACTQLQTASVEAVETLRGCLHSESDHARVRAASVIIERAITSHEMLDLAVRIAALEVKAHEREAVK